MTSLQAKIKDHFEKALESYDHSSRVQQMAGLHLIKMLKHLKIKHILDLGCGTGLTTESLCHHLQISKPTLCDLSELFIQKALERTARFSPIALPMNFDTSWDHLPQFDLIFSNMAMQWSEDLHSLLKKSFDHLNPNGWLAFTIPLDGTFLNLSTLGCQVNKFYKSEFIETMLKHTRFSIVSADVIEAIDSYHTVFEALKDLKHTGANCVFNRDKNHFFNRNILKKPGALEYKIGLFIARKEKS